MASIKISQLTAAAAASDTQEFEVNEAGVSKKVTGSQIKANVKSGFVAADITDVTASAAELNFVDGVTSAIQTQLNAKAPLASPNFTGDIDLQATGPVFAQIKANSSGAGNDDDASLILDAAENGKSIIRFRNGGVDKALIEWFNAGPDLNITTLAGTSGNIDLNPDGVLALRVAPQGTVTFYNAIQETVYDLAGTVIDPSNGTIQTKTLAANTTFTETLAAGESVVLMISDGAGFTATWPAIVWKNNAGAAPTLATSGYTVIALWKVSTTLYGVLVGDGT